MTDPPPDRPSPVKVGSLRGFLPLNDAPVTTRGQKLPSLIQSRSSANIHDLKKRRQITIQGENDTEDNDVERHADGVDFRWDGSPPTKRKYSRGERRGSAMSEISQIMNTPQMRSLRLIGNSNPRYQWYVGQEGPQMLHQHD